MPVSTIDEYIVQFDSETQNKLNAIRTIIKKAAPEAVETMGYGVPTFKLKRNLVHFAAFKKHIGFYPSPSGIERFKEELKTYKRAKGSVQFPLDQEIPYDLIQRIVIFRVEEETLKS